MNSYLKARIIPDFLDLSAAVHPEKTALTFEGSTYSYSQVLREVERISRFLIGHTRKGDIIGLLLPNTPEFIFSYFGIMKAGCTVLLFPMNISDDNMLYQISQTNPKFVLTVGQYEKKLKRIEQDELFVNVNEISFSGTSNSGKKRTVTPNDISSIIYTSGTTSAPKGVVLRHKNVVQATKNIIEYVDFQHDDIDVNISALSHSFGLGHIHCVFAVGGSIILFRNAINLKEIINSIEKEKATTFGAVPAVLRLILQHYRDEFKKSGKNLRFVQSNTSPLEKELIIDVLKTLPKTKFHYYYGLTEASRSTFITFNDSPDKLNSVGRPSPHVSVKIVGENGRKVKVNEVGEICIKGKHVISEYWMNKTASKRIKNDWLYTKDAGYADAEGFIYFVGRTDDVINVAGEKVSPDEIEEAAKRLSWVKDAAAVGVPDRLLGEVVKLYIVTDKATQGKDLLPQLREKLESFKVPRYIEEVTSIPKTENGKIKRQYLKNSNG